MKVDFSVIDSMLNTKIRSCVILVTKQVCFFLSDSGVSALSALKVAFGFVFE